MKSYSSVYGTFYNIAYKKLWPLLQSTIKFLLALRGLELGHSGALRGRVDPLDFVCGETRNSKEETCTDVGSPSSWGNLTRDICIPKNKFLCEQVWDSQRVKHSGVCVLQTHPLIKRTWLRVSECPIGVPCPWWLWSQGKILFWNSRSVPEITLQCLCDLLMSEALFPPRACTCAEQRRDTFHMASFLFPWH